VRSELRDAAIVPRDAENDGSFDENDPIARGLDRKSDRSRPKFDPNRDRFMKKGAPSAAPFRQRSVPRRSPPKTER
jgi:hypothetical protein